MVLCACAAGLGRVVTAAVERPPCWQQEEPRGSLYVRRPCFTLVNVFVITNISTGSQFYVVHLWRADPVAIIVRFLEAVLQYSTTSLRRGVAWRGGSRSNELRSLPRAAHRLKTQAAQHSILPRVIRGPCPSRLFSLIHSYLQLIYHLQRVNNTNAGR